MDRYKLQELIADNLADAAQWARGDGDDFTRDDIERVFDETLDSALIYTRDVHALWDDFGNPEPTELADTLSASILFAVVEAVHESDVLANAIEEAELTDVWDAS